MQAISKEDLIIVQTVTLAINALKYYESNWDEGFLAKQTLDDISKMYKFER